VASWKKWEEKKGKINNRDREFVIRVRSDHFSVESAAFCWTYGYVDDYETVCKFRKLSIGLLNQIKFLVGSYLQIDAVFSCRGYRW
jgi:hypothetical protein